MSSVPTPVADGLFQTDPPALLGGVCERCGARQFPAGLRCQACQAAAIAVVPLEDTGTLYTFTIVRVSPPGYEGPCPYAIGVVELPSGIRVTATILARELDALAIGDPVRFALHELDGSDSKRVQSFCYRRADT